MRNDSISAIVHFSLRFTLLLLMALMIHVVALADPPAPTPTQDDKLTAELQNKSDEYQKFYSPINASYQNRPLWSDDLVKGMDLSEDGIKRFSSAVERCGSIVTKQGELDTSDKDIVAKSSDLVTYLNQHPEAAMSTDKEKEYRKALAATLSNMNTLHQEISDYQKVLHKLDDQGNITVKYDKILGPASTLYKQLSAKFEGISKAFAPLPTSGSDNLANVRKALSEQVSEYNKAVGFLVLMMPVQASLAKSIPADSAPLGSATTPPAPPAGAPAATPGTGTTTTTTSATTPAASPTYHDDLDKASATAKSLQQPILAYVNFLLDYVGANQATLLEPIYTQLQGRILDNKMLARFGDVQLLINQMKTLGTEWKECGVTLTGQKLLTDDGKKITDSISRMTDYATILSAPIDLSDDDKAGNGNQFISEQVRLFYYTDVPRIMKALNPKAELVSISKENYEEKYNTAHAQLIETDRKLLGAMTDVNAGQRRMLDIQEEIRQVTARANDEKNRWKIVKQQQLDYQNKQDEINKKLAVANISDSEKASLNDQLTQVTAKLTAQNQVVADEEMAKQQADDQQQQLRQEQAALPTKLDDAKTRYTQAQHDLMNVRLDLAKYAQADTEAFADMRDNAPYWFAAANQFSPDPAHRVIIHAYPDGKTIFLRGKPDDVEHVKEIIAGFDRPAPQARITLWTLQINSVKKGGWTDERYPQAWNSDKKINTALKDVDQTLQDYRSNVILLQEMLRESILQEVNRVMDVTEIATGVDEDSSLKDYHMEGRLARYFIYPDEFRKQLGFPCTLPDLAEYPAIMRKEFQQAKESFLEAARIHNIPKNNMSDNEKDSFNQECGVYLVNMKYHLSQTGEAWKKLKSKIDNVIANGNLSGLTVSEKSSYFQADTLIDFTIDNYWSRAVFDTADPDQTIKNYTPLFDVNNPKQLDISQYIEVLLGYGRKIVSSQPASEYDRFLHQAEQNDVAYITERTLPDPTSATTLGEMLFTLSLMERSSRERILHNFLREVNLRYLNHNQIMSTGMGRFSIAILKHFSPNISITKQHTNFDQSDALYPLFPRILSDDLPGRVPSESIDWGINANQREIFRAVQTRARESVAREVLDLIHQMDGNTPINKQIIRLQYLPLVGWLAANYNLNPSALSTLPAPTTPALTASGSFAITPPVPGANPIFSASGSISIMPSALNSTTTTPPTPGSAFPSWYSKGLLVTTGQTQMDLDKLSPDQLKEMDATAKKLAQLEYRNNSLARASARVAAADDMLKRFIQVAEGDLEHFFFQPALDKIDETMDKHGLELGVLQRESLLVTNRMVARMDPSASADAELAPGTDFLQAATQLGELSMRYAEAKQYTQNAKLTNTSPLLGALGATQLADKAPATVVGVGAGISLLGAMMAQPQQPTGEVYAFNNGNLFKVTPIFDPSGQAMRFKFDFSSTVRIQEPDNTTNPQLPRVDRHTVNTEVQLTNLELREVSRFTANTKVGVPERRTGGIPLLNELPLIKELPILGYYFKQKAVSGQYQESVIFAQTSIYPTVSDIIDLLVDAQRHPAPMPAD